MGEVIRKDAAADAVLADVRTALDRATARGGGWASSAHDRLDSVLRLYEATSVRLLEAQRTFGPLSATVAAQDAECDALIGRVSDTLWNLIGRPGSDATFDVLFPGGIAYYAEGDTSEQPDRMLLLADLLRANLHPRIPSDVSNGFASEIEAAAEMLRKSTREAAPHAARVALATRMRTALGRTGALALAGLKRSWKADGHSEAEIHSVIPDRPRSTAPKAAEPA